MDIRRVFTTIDTHTAGGPTRIITSGLPALVGASVREKFDWFKDHLDPIRRLLLNEPRGHRDMYGAVVTPATDPTADLGIFFPTAGGYLPTCVHSSIGAAVALLETGALSLTDSRRELRFETPSGMVVLEPRREDHGSAIALKTQPAFIQQLDARLEVSGHQLTVDLVFSGVFFVLIDAARNGLDLGRERLPELIALGQQVLTAANRDFSTGHPDRSVPGPFALALFYQRTGERQVRDVIVGRTGSVDRSPCGAGCGALAVLLRARDGIGIRESITIEGVIGTRFAARVLEDTTVDGYPAGRPEIVGTAYITGFHQFVLGGDDPLHEGFLLG